jgi:glycosyltransferase involved in cell wall biosynthesis
MRCPDLDELPAPAQGREGWPWTETSPRLPDTGPDGQPSPRITVVTPSFNQGAFLEETIRSVLLQGYPDLEYIVVDGESHDGSVDITRKYEPWLAHWVSESDRGQVDAINKGLARATGVVFNWINSDDLLVRGVLGTVARAFDGADMVVGTCLHFGDGFSPTLVKSRNLTARDLVLRHPGDAVFQQPATWLEREKLGEAGGLDPQFHFAFDLDMMIRYLYRFPRVSYLEATLARFRRHEASKTESEPERFGEEIELIREKLARSEQMGSLRRLCGDIIPRKRWRAELERIIRDFSRPGWKRAWWIWRRMWARPSARLTLRAFKALRRCLLGKHRSRRAFERAAERARRRGAASSGTDAMPQDPRRAAAGAAAWLSSSERQFRKIWPSIDSIEGLLTSPAQERWLFEAARSLPSSGNIVEIGSFKGRSTSCLAYGCRGTGKHVFAIDTFDGNDVDFHRRQFFEEFMKNLEERSLSEYVVPLKGVSAEVARAWDRPIDLLFIDGSHQYEDVVADFSGFFRHVIPGGIVAVHDVACTWPGPERAWHENIKGRLEDVGYCGSLAYGAKP